MTTPRSRIALAFATCVAAIGIVVSTGPAQAAGSIETIVVNSIDDQTAIDIYADGTLVGANATFGQATEPFTLPPADGHLVEVFPAISNPPAASSDRTDEPVEAGQFAGQAGPGTTTHPDGPLLIRIYNATNGVWFLIEHEIIEPTFSCDPTFATSVRYFSADVFVGTGAGGGSGEQGVVESRRGYFDGYQYPVVLRADRFGGATEPEPYVFGSFDLGVVTYRLGNERVFLAHGHRGSYGVVEAVVDCTTGTFDSVRTVPRNPVFASSKFIPVDPVRLFDTREPAPPSGSLAPGDTLDVQVAGEVGIPSTGVTAVVLNVTATASSGPGFVTVWPKGAPQPTTSNLNVTAAAQTVPNLVTVPLGTDGQVSFFSLSGIDLLADVAGYFVAADSASGGRFVPVEPTRVFDTREAPEPQGVVGPGSSIRVPIAGDNGIPDSGADAVVLNVTGVNVGGPGFITVHPGGNERPEASNVNLLFPGDIAPNLVVVPLGDDGTVEFYSSSGADILADVFGYFTDATAPPSASGLFVPTTPTRVIDTRPTSFNRRTDRFIESGEAIDVVIAGTGDVPGAGASAVLSNVTATQAAAPGFVTIWPSGLERPEISNLNLNEAGATRPNAALVPLGGPGDIGVYSLNGNHVIVDVFGFFTE